MNERHGPGHGLSEHELSEIRMLIEERTGIYFDESRERFFSTRVEEHLRAKATPAAPTCYARFARPTSSTKPCSNGC